jgi:hypothetical protein
VKEKFLLKVNKKFFGFVNIDISKLRDKDLGRKEIIKRISSFSKLRKQFLGKEIVGINLSLTPKPEINIQIGEKGTAKKRKKKGEKEIRPILEALRKGDIKSAEKETAEFILTLLDKFDNKEIGEAEISEYLDVLWWSRGFIEKMPEPLNSAVLEGADLGYYHKKGKESNYHLQEARGILNYLRKFAEEILKKGIPKNKVRS